MRLTQYTDYCLRTLMFVAIKRPELATIREVSGAYGISRNHMMKVVYDLNRMGYVETLRGRNGGMRLRRPPCEISVGELVRRTESDFAVVECFTPANACPITAACRLRGMLGEALDAFMQVLDRYSLEELISERRCLAELLQMAAPANTEGGPA